MNKRKTKTTIEIHQVYVIRPSEPHTRVFCPECTTGRAAMVTPEEAAFVATIPVRRIYRMIEAGLIHYLEAEDGSLLTCLDSLQMAGNRSGND